MQCHDTVGRTEDDNNDDKGVVSVHDRVMEDGDASRMRTESTDGSPRNAWEKACGEKTDDDDITIDEGPRRSKGLIAEFYT